MAKKNERLSARIDEDLKAAMSRTAEAGGGTISAVLDVAVREWFRDGEEVAKMKFQKNRSGSST